MSLVLNEEQVFLKDSAKKFASEKTPTTHFREVRDSEIDNCYDCLLYTSPSPRDTDKSRMPSSA